MTITIDQDYIINTLTNIVKINSVNPGLTPEGQGEAEIAAYVTDNLSSIGLETKTYEVEPGRVNAVGRLKGSGSGRSLLLNAHLDTVGVEGMVGDPFGAEIQAGKLYGRGAQDMKGSLAAMMGAAKALVDAGIKLGGDLFITGVADEEFASIGTQNLLKHVTADAAIVTEPTDLQLCRAHRGFIWYDVETIGRAAHGSRYDEGIDANMRMGRFLGLLDNLEQELRQRPEHPILGTPSLHAARLQGGSEVSIYAAHCLLQIERRTVPGEPEPQITAELQTIIDQLADTDPTFKATVQPKFERDPFEIGPEAEIVNALENAIEGHLAQVSPHIGATFWTDAAFFAAAGIETALIGPIGGGLHSKEEWVEIQSVVDLATILAQVAENYCQ